jgi:NADH dehydrogenase FAD-containing subunit
VSQIVVLGAGYSGIQAARVLALSAPKHLVTLVDRLPHHQLTTQFPATVTGRLTTGRAFIPLERIVPTSVRILRAEIESVSRSPFEIQTSLGAVPADWLAVCLGTTSSDLGVPGAREHALPLKSVQDCMRLRNCVRDLVSSRGLTRIVVVGGGYSGTEVAGELTDPQFVTSTRGLEVTIVQPDNRLLPQGSSRLADAVQRILTKRGVRTLCGVWLSEVDAEGICLDTGEKLAADLVVWTASTRPTPVVKQTFEISPEGRIPVDPYLRPPNTERVYVAGDLAALQDLHGGLYPASAQIAVAQGTRIGQNIIAELASKLPVEFKPRLLGEALALGRHAAAAEVGGVLSTGRLAHAMKRVALFRYLAGFGSPSLLRDYL